VRFGRLFGRVFWRRLAPLARRPLRRKPPLQAPSTPPVGGAMPHTPACCARPPPTRRHTTPTRSPHALKNGSPAAVEGARRSRGSGAPACGRRSRTACESVRQGPPAGGELSTSKAGFRRNERLAKDAKRRQNTPPKRPPKRATKNAAIRFKNGVHRRTFHTNMDAGFRWPFAPLRSVKIWPRKRGQITHTLGHFWTSRLRICENTAYLSTFSNLLSKFSLKCEL
jgi:hypothetical protein